MNPRQTLPGGPWAQIPPATAPFQRRLAPPPRDCPVPTLVGAPPPIIRLPAQRVGERIAGRREASGSDRGASRTRPGPPTCPMSSERPGCGPTRRA